MIALEGVLDYEKGHTYVFLAFGLGFRVKVLGLGLRLWLRG